MFTFNAIQMGCCDLTGEVGVCFLKALKYKELAGMEPPATMLMAPEDGLCHFSGAPQGGRSSLQKPRLPFPGPRRKLNNPLLEGTNQSSGVKCEHENGIYVINKG